MGKIVQYSIENFKGGLSCSEAVVKACYDLGLVDDSLINIATSFSGGMQSGCICGAIAGAQMVIGFLHGRNKDYSAKEKAKLFIQKFKEFTGVTPAQYILNVRLAIAKNLLRYSKYNVSETAAAVGYTNAFYFSRLFTKYVGVSPSKYKAQIEENENS